MSTDWKKGRHKVFFLPVFPFVTPRTDRVLSACQWFFFICLFTLFIWAWYFYKLIFSDHLPTQICTWVVFFLFILFRVYHNSFWWKLNLSTTTKGLFVPYAKKKNKLIGLIVLNFMIFFFLTLLFFLLFYLYN